MHVALDYQYARETMDAWTEMISQIFCQAKMLH